MNKEQIKSKMQSIEESIKEQTNELNKLRAEMDKPEKPTLEEMCEGMGMWYINDSGKLYPYNDGAGYKAEAYLSRERAEKELLRIKLSVIADYLNGGLFEPKECEIAYCLLYNQSTNRIEVDSWEYIRKGQIWFKTREHAELAMTTYFTNDELIKTLR